MNQDLEKKELSLNELSVEHDSLTVIKGKQLALRIIRMSLYLKQKGETVLSEKALDSGTEVGRLLRCADNVETISEYFEELKKAVYKIEETMYWLELLYESRRLSKEQFDSIYKDCKGLSDELKAGFIGKFDKEKTG